jgi:hypothetical protein
MVRLIAAVRARRESVRLPAAQTYEQACQFGAGYCWENLYSDAGKYAASPIHRFQALRRLLPAWGESHGRRNAAFSAEGRTTT